MTDDYNARVWMVLNSAHEALQWDNTFRSQMLGHANTVFFTQYSGAERAMPDGGSIAKAAGDASMILKSNNVT